MHLTLSLTHNCNLSCHYCYAGEKKALVMSRSTAINAVEMILAENVDNSRRLEVGFFGGEPLLEWDLLVFIMEYIKQRCADISRQFCFTITTNGTMLTKDKIQYLNKSGCYTAISIDGNRQMHDCNRTFLNTSSSWEATLCGLKTALTHDASIETISVVTPNNVEYASDGIIWLAENTSVNFISINPDFYCTWDESHCTQLAESMEKITDYFIKRYHNGRPLRISFIHNKVVARIKGGLSCEDHCGFGKQEIAVAPSGRIYPCERLIGNDTDDTMCIGTVNNGIDVQRVMALYENRAPQSPVCNACSIKNVCQNSCGCTNYLMTGNTGKVDGRVCFFERIATKAADRAAKTLYEGKNRWFIRDYYGEDVDS